MFMSWAPGVQHLKKKRKVIIRINKKREQKENITLKT